MSEEMNEMNDMGGGEIDDSDKMWVFIAYIVAPVAIVLLLMEDKKAKPFVKYHAIQALIIGILSYVLGAACIGVLIWFYGIYVGWQAYSTGEMVEIPMLSDFIKNQGWV